MRLDPLILVIGIPFITSFSFPNIDFENCEKIRERERERERARERGRQRER